MMHGIKFAGVIGVLMMALSVSTWATSIGSARHPEWDSESYLPSLIRALSDEDYTTRRAAARALGRMGPKARTALPYLCCAAGDREESVREMVQEAALRIDPEFPKSSLEWARKQ